jgi:hypothetical protein
VCLKDLRLAIMPELVEFPRQICALVGLERLKLDRCRSGVFSSMPDELNRLTSLRTLELDSISDGETVELPAIVGELKSLDSLSLFSSSVVTSIEALAPLAQLIELDIAMMYRLEHFGVLAHLRSLRRLTASFHAISDLTPIAGLPALEELDLSSCRSVTDLEPLRGNKTLKRLNISSTHVGDLSPLSECTALEHLDISYCSADDDGRSVTIEALIPLVPLTHLEEVESGEISQDEWLARGEPESVFRLNILDGIRAKIDALLREAEEEDLREPLEPLLAFRGPSEIERLTGALRESLKLIAEQEHSEAITRIDFHYTSEHDDYEAMANWRDDNGELFAEEVGGFSMQPVFAAAKAVQQEHDAGDLPLRLARQLTYEALHLAWASLRRGPEALPVEVTTPVRLFLIEHDDTPFLVYAS